MSQASRKAVDCRRLGLPVCSRIVPGLTFSLTELLQLVPVTPPEDFSVHIGGRFTGDEDALSFEDRDSVAIWFEPPVSSEAAPSSPATDGADGRDQLSLSDGEGSEEDTVGHRGAGATRRGMSRSRSPPPTASGGHRVVTVARLRFLMPLPARMGGALKLGAWFQNGIACGIGVYVT